METQSEPGGLHENSLLLVMGDHGQTLNGDHGGGTAEEVETAMFAMSTKKPTPYLPLEVDNSYCRSNVEGKNLCISSIQQLDFSVTVAALFGIPFPFGSLGKINPELHALATAVRNLGSSDSVNAQNRSETEDWMEIYANSLCINSWQVKRYIDVYSGSSVIGFSDNDLKDISDLYEEANKIQYHASHSSLSKSKLKIDAYSKFLTTVAGIARSKWTEFNLTMMITGFSIMLASIFGHIFLIKWLVKDGLRFSSCSSPVVSFEMIFAYIVVFIRSCSFLSNSFILEEGKVGSFLLATTAILQLRYALMKKKMILEAILFILLIPIVSFGIQLGQFKQAVNSLFLKVSDSWMLGINSESYIWINTVEVLPILVLIILACLLFKGICQRSFIGSLSWSLIGTIFSYMLIAMYWASDSHLLSQHAAFGVIRGNVIPRVVYTVSLLQVLFLAIIHLFGTEKTTVWKEKLVGKALAMLCSWSSTVILLSGKQGSIVALASVLGGWCIIKLMSIEGDPKNGMAVTASYSSHTIRWNLLAVCLFFCTGHWCAFDGLRYASAFIGFDEFNLIRQAVLLTIETFGFSHILPIIGLPFLVAYQHRAADKGTEGHVLQLCLVYLIYGLTIVIGVTFTILCVIIQRRHLMVWGLFAPKFVFDVVALFLSDLFICLASFYYIV
ncbi:hypothetical protein Leryth_007418 [Lithospermum erythrorhizon]|nr:hypothetical protein Leryth_007418 [Lithospermum erythrorhizon]